MFTSVSFAFIAIFQIANVVHGKELSRRAELKQSSDLLIVKTATGLVSGILGSTVDKNTPYISYRGIPYAQPPIGDLRFRAPLPANNWSDILHAHQDGSACVQTLPGLAGSEDCLFINVYTPKLKRDGSLLPVLVWIHGGAFIFGDASYENFGPDFFLNEDLMFVSFNYRLGIFGFLSTEDMESPGNYGLKDQILALKWVQTNIEEFGGDPKSVTIFGESAGAASVSYLVQSRLTRGLFQRAISNSGNTLCQWALTRHPKSIAESVARRLNVDTSSTRRLVDGLRRADYKSLHDASFGTQIETFLNDYLHGLVYSPTIEPAHEGAVLSSKSHQQLANHGYNKVPYLMGFNSKEASGWLEHNAIFNLPINLVGAPLLAALDLNNSKLVPHDMNVESHNLRTVTQKIRNLYFERYQLIVLHSRRLEDFISDDQFVRPVRETVRLYSRDVPVYYYRFSYMGNIGLSKDESRRVATEGVAHAEDLNYLFRVNTSKTEGPKADFRTRYRLVRLWSNFAKTGNPTPGRDGLLDNVIWPVTRRNAAESTFVYLDIGERLRIEQNPEQSNIVAWNDLYQRYGRPPFDTY